MPDQAGREATACPYCNEVGPCIDHLPGGMRKYTSDEPYCQVRRPELAHSECPRRVQEWGDRCPEHAPAGRKPTEGGNPIVACMTCGKPCLGGTCPACFEPPAGRETSDGPSRHDEACRSRFDADRRAHGPTPGCARCAWIEDVTSAGRQTTPHEVRVREAGDTSAAFCRCGWQGWSPSYRLAFDKGEAHKAEERDRD